MCSVKSSLLTLGPHLPGSPISAPHWATQPICFVCLFRVMHRIPKCLYANITKCDSVFLFAPQKTAYDIHLSETFRFFTY